MKIQKLKNIKNYKSFTNFEWQKFLNNDPFHNEMNILYGENGSGKSSICNILKNLSDNKDFGKNKPDEVCITLDEGDKKFSVNNWDSKVQKESMLFFDREFVTKNVHEYERKTTKDGQEQQSGKLIIEFDSDAINLRDTRDKSKKAKEVQDEKVEKFKNTNKDILNRSLSDEDKDLFNKYKARSDNDTSTERASLDKERKEIEKALDQDNLLQKKSSEIQKDVNLLSINLENLKFSTLEKYKDLFNFDLKEKTKIEAESELVKIIKEHKHFFDEGMALRESHPNKCPFCQSDKQEDSIKNVIDLYNQIYDSVYKNSVSIFEQNKKNLIDEISTIKTAINNYDPTSIFIELKRLEQNYKIPDIYSSEEEKIFRVTKINFIDNLLNKILSLSKPNKEDITEDYNLAKNEFVLIEKIFSDISNLIQNKNIIIQRFKTDNTDDKLQKRITLNSQRLNGINIEILFIDSKKTKQINEKIDKEKQLQELQKELSALDVTYKAHLKMYEEYCSGNAFTNILKKIEEYFKKFKFNFKLELRKESTGNKNEFPFAFKVLDIDGNERDFKDGLSEGEVQVLSLCFFFAFLDIQDNKTEKILIFDDPITSLDNSNLASLVDLIAEEKSNFSQTFVFTHHRAFYKFLRKRFYKHCQEYSLIRNKKTFGGSFICKGEKEQFLDRLGDFENHLLQIQPANLDTELKVVEYGQFLRYEVERYIKNTLLHWDADSNFSLAIDGVKNNKQISDDDLNEIKDIYSFCNWTTSHVDVGEDNGLEQLKQKIADFMRIVKPTVNTITTP
jgi:wobble nucleotide-excising tRNase